MLKKESFTLGEKELLEIANLKEVNFSHERSHSSPTGIKAILNHFLDHERNKVDTHAVANRVIFHLRREGIITGEEKCNFNFHPRHSWGAENEEGNLVSVYSVSLEIYRQVYIKINQTV